MVSTQPLPPLPVDALADGPMPGVGPEPRTIGHSRDGRPLHGHRLGRGPLRVSLIAGCHADEPVGPAMLARLVAWLAARPDDDPHRAAVSWWIVPHANPDGAARNAAWSARTIALDDGRAGYDLAAYLRHAVREAPGDDVEFGFPRASDDRDARPENRAVADVLRDAAPLDLHASFHGMAFAAGPWFLLDRRWIDRTGDLRDALRARVAERGYRCHDIDRRGDKGFTRIDEGFTTRPAADAMIAHFRARGDAATAARFRPSSMDVARALGGDPLTLVSEMPLFLAPRAWYDDADDVVRPAALARFKIAATRAAHDAPDDEMAARAVDDLCAAAGVRPMPLADQMRFQLAFLDHALRTVVRARAAAP